jgi:hypothetical protein
LPVASQPKSEADSEASAIAGAGRGFCAEIPPAIAAANKMNLKNFMAVG